MGVPVVAIGYDDVGWYEVLVEECKAIITEAVFNSRWALVDGYHRLGESVVTNEKFQKHAKGNKSSVQDLGRKLGISTSTLYYAMQFYEKYPRLDMLPDGKNISWNKIITQYLPEKSKEVIPEWVHRWEAVQRLAGQIAEDREAPEGIKKVCRSLCDLTN